MNPALGLRRAVLLGVTLLSFGGCVGAPSDTKSLNGGTHLVQESDSGLVSATVTLDEPSTLTRGQNSFLVQLDPADDGGADAPVLSAASATMPAHGHSVTATNIVAVGTAYRIADLDLFMSGVWQVDLTVTLGTRMDHVEFSLDVP
jgi:hypothetical protein